MYFREGDAFRAVAMHGAPPAYRRIAAAQARSSRPGYAASAVLCGQSRLSKSKTSARPGLLRARSMRVAAVELGGVRTLLGVPMLKENELIGAIAIYRARGAPVHRQANRAGAELRRPGRHRHREHAAAQRIAAQSLEQQTATAEVLERHQLVAGRLEPVFQAMLENAVAHLRGQVRHAVPVRRRSVPHGGECRYSAGV